MGRASTHLAGRALWVAWLQCQTRGGCVQASLERLQEAAPSYAAELRRVAAPGQMQDAEFHALLAQQGCSAYISRREYVSRAVEHLLLSGVRWQADAFAEVGSHMAWQGRCCRVRAAVCANNEVRKQQGFDSAHAHARRADVSTSISGSLPALEPAQQTAEQPP